MARLIHERPAAMEAARTMRAWTFRVENIPPETTAERLKEYFHTEDQTYIQVRSIVPAVDCEGPDGELTATISFQTWDETITAPRVLDDTVSVDSDFHGFTPLSQPKGPISADIIAVTGLAAHAYGSWAHSSRNMWLRDYLPKDVANARVLIYGYPSQLRGSASSGILADHTNNFIHRLLSMRELTRCQDRPIVFIGHSLGCLIIKKAISDVNGSIGRYSSRLPVCAIIFFGAPHRGLQTTALETLVKSQPTEEMLRELRARSPTLNELNDRFRFVANDIDILTCFELWQTKTAVEMPDGSWKREGIPEMMVYQDSAQLNFPKEKMVSCHADHSQMAKLRRGESGPYPDIKRAIKQALLRVMEEPANVGLSRLQLPSGVKTAVEERLGHTGDYIKGSGPERTPVPAGKSPLDDAQSQGSSISEPQEKTADVPHDKDQVSAPSSPASDGCESGFIVQNKQATTDHTMNLPGTEAMSRDGEELPEGDTEVLNASMQRATDASSDRRNGPSSPLKKQSPEKAMGSVKDPKLRLKLCSASKKGDVEKVRSLLAQGCSIHESSEDLVDVDKDAFLLAASNGRLDVLKVLLQHDCDISKRSLNGNTALHLISFDEEIKPKPVIESLIILLLEHGVPLEARRADGFTALLLSAGEGKISIAECLLEHGTDIHAAANDGHTALHCAALHGHHEVVALLISKGADIHAAANDGHTALHWAALQGHHEVVALLILKGADIQSTVNIGCTALHVAAHLGHHEVVTLLILKGADIQSTDNNGNTALHWAVDKGHHEVVALLISKGADIQSTNSAGYTALHWAAQKGHHEVVALLISKGARLETRAKGSSYTPLHFSCLADNDPGESVKLLLQAGADKEATTEFQLRPLLLAASSGNLGVVNELLAFRVNVDTVTDTGWSALHYAKHLGHWRMIEALLAKGANPMLENSQSERPLNVSWTTKVTISPEDRLKCLKLLEDAEKAWKERRRRERKERGMGGFRRFIAEFAD